MSRVPESALRDANNCFVQIGVTVNNDRVLSTHLGHDVFDRCLRGVGSGGLLVDGQAHLARTGEGDDFDTRASNQHRPDLFTDPWKEANHPIGNASRLDNFHKFAADNRRLFRRKREH